MHYALEAQSYLSNFDASYMLRSPLIFWKQKKKMNNVWTYLLTYLLTELSLSWEDANCAATQELPSIFFKPEGSLPRSQEPSTSTYPKPDRSSPPHPISLKSILILSTHLRLSLPSGLLPAFPPISYTHSSSPPIRATCPAHLILLDFIILIIFTSHTLYSVFNATLQLWVLCLMLYNMFRPHWAIIGHPAAKTVPM
jgi:hypothetical protein